MIKSIGFAGVVSLLLMASVALGTSTTAITITDRTGQVRVAPILGAYSVGYEFEVTAPAGILVTNIGIYTGPDPDGNVLSSGHNYQVGIWSIQSELQPSMGSPTFVAGPLLVYGTVNSTDAFDGNDNFFRFAGAYGNVQKNEQPGVLQPGHYLIASEAVDNLYLVSARAFHTSDEVSIGPISNYFGYWGSTTTVIPAPVYGPDVLITNGYWGPNFQYVTEPFSVTVNPVPEPVTMASLGLAILGLSGYIRRRRALGGLPKT